MLFLKLNLQEKGHVYANCMFHILAVQRKFLPFQFLLRGICMDIPI